MYAVLILPEHGEVTLATEFSCRREFLAAMGYPDTPEGWNSAIEYERAVFEITNPDQVQPVLEEVWSSITHHYDACVRALSLWASTDPATDPPDIRRPGP